MTDCPIQALRRTPQASARAPVQGERRSTCQWCGSATCHRCSRHGHFQIVCRAPPQASQIYTDQEHEGDPTSFLGGVMSQRSPTGWTVTLRLNGQPTTFLIDTGAEVMVISERTHNSIGSTPLSSPLAG